MTGKEQTDYLLKLDSYLSCLANTLGLGIDEAQVKAIKEFGDAEKWDWTRLAAEEDTYLELGTLVEEVRRNYRWFDWIKNNKDAKLNRGYFDKVEISTSSGMPWIFNLIELHRLKENAQQELSSFIGYEDLAKKLEELGNDTVEFQNLPSEAERIYKTALKRSFLEQLAQTELIAWKTGGLKPVARKVIPFGSEDLWRIKHARYMSSNMFEIYVVDVWQDLNEPQIIEKDGVVEVSPALEQALKFGANNTAWFVLKELDESFRSIHPVHISRGIVGPFENRYAEQLENGLPISAEILKENPEFGILRFKRQYSYAPNHIVEKGGEKRQVIYHQDWNDEILVCPGGYSARVANSVLGTNVRVVGV